MVGYSVTRKPTESKLILLLSSTCKTPMVLTQPSRNVHRLRLLYLVFTPTLVSCPLLYYLPCRNHGWPIKRKLNFGSMSEPFDYSVMHVLDRVNSLLVDQGGIEPPSRIWFKSLHTTISYYISNRYIWQ